jgi:PKD repeat protein
MKKILVVLMMLVSGWVSAQTEVFDLTTGSTGGFPLAIGGFDDTWTVRIPASAVFQNVNVSSGCLFTGFNVNCTAWASNQCGRWLSPYIVSTAGASFGAATTAAPAGNYTYRTTFMANPNNCPVASAFLNINFLGADNSVSNITVNGTNYPASAVFNPLSSPGSIAVNPGDIISGLNTIDIVVNNLGIYTGLFLCGNLTVNYNCPQPCQVNVEPKADKDDKDCSLRHFTSNASAGGSTIISGYFWDFGDGTTSTLPNPDHLYLYNGTYQVTLTVIGITETGDCCVATKTIWVEVYCDCKPVVDGILVTVDGNCGYTFTTANNHTGTAQFIAWQWNFGDGTIGYGQSVTHQYSGNGTYTVSVQVTAFNGQECCTAEVVKLDVDVQCEGGCKIEPNFTYVQSLGGVVTFTNTSVGLYNTTLAGYYWSFDDGTFSTDENPVHTFEQGRAYKVCLTVYGFYKDQCCSGKICYEIYVAHDWKSLVHNNSETGESIEAQSMGSLQQNRPNPFIDNTIIEYNISDGFKKASIEIWSIQGVLVQSQQISSAGRGTMVIQGNSFQAGIYNYRLIVDGNVVGNKKMVLLNN